MPDGENDVEFFFNELSLHGQFNNSSEFAESIDILMQIRASIRRNGANVYCRRDLTSARVTPSLAMPQVINQLPREKRSAWVSWIAQQGPFWQDERRHSDDDWLETEEGAIVTDSSLGELAFRTQCGLDGALVSLSPSHWLRAEISVRYRRNDTELHPIRVANHWSEEAAVAHLAASGPRYSSWATLAAFLTRKCDRLHFAHDAFSPLDGQPFHYGVAERFDVLLTTLNRLKGCFHADGTRTEEGDWLYREHFNHTKAWFTDSSDSEKSEFREELTFPHPERPNDVLFCPMHGKVKTPQFRVHFTWPCQYDTSLYVVYVGPKLTKR